jgi:hypothetical protein
MVCDVLQPIVVRRAEQRKHAEPVADEVVDNLVLEERAVRRLMGEPRELMLAGADKQDGSEGDRDVPQPGVLIVVDHGVEIHRRPHDDDEIEPGADEVPSVGPVVGRTKRLDLRLDGRVLDGRK